MENDRPGFPNTADLRFQPALVMMTEMLGGSPSISAAATFPSPRQSSDLQEINGKTRHVASRSVSASTLLHPCCVGDCILAIHPTSAQPTAARDSQGQRANIGGADQVALLHTASAARWRRRQNNLSNSNSDNEKLRERANAELVLKVAVMEEVHGVDVSWLHHTNKGML